MVITCSGGRLTLRAYVGTWVSEEVVETRSVCLRTLALRVSDQVRVHNSIAGSFELYGDTAVIVESCYMGSLVCRGI